MSPLSSRPTENEVFIYFSTTEKSDPGLMEAIGDLGVPVRLFMPSIDAATAEHFIRRGIHVEQSPVPVDLLAKRTRLMVNAAQHGILCLALAAGLPQVSVPQHLEQTYHAEATASRGVLRSVSRAESDVESFKSIVLGALRGSFPWATGARTGARTQAAFPG